MEDKYIPAFLTTAWVLTFAILFWATVQKLALELWCIAYGIFM